MPKIRFFPFNVFLVATPECPTNLLAVPPLPPPRGTSDGGSEARTHFIKQLWRDRLKGVQRNIEVRDWFRSCQGR